MPISFYRGLIRDSSLTYVVGLAAKTTKKPAAHTFYEKRPTKGAPRISQHTNIHADTNIHTHKYTHTHYPCRYGVALIGRLLKIVNLFSKRAL